MDYDTVMDKLRRMDELTLLEILDLTSEELVQIFKPRILDRWDHVLKEVGDDEEEEDSAEASS